MLGCPEPGYNGVNCSTPCPDPNCRYCHIETGACQGCKPGYQGHRCEGNVLGNLSLSLSLSLSHSAAENYVQYFSLKIEKFVHSARLASIRCGPTTCPQLIFIPCYYNSFDQNWSSWSIHFTIKNIHVRVWICNIWGPVSRNFWAMSRSDQMPL